jgi:hypothetical protein
MTQPIDSSEPPKPKRQFTIRAILFATTLVAVAAAGFGGLVRAKDDELPVFFVLFVIAAPLAFMLVQSAYRGVENFIAMRRRLRDAERRVRDDGL